MTTNAKQLAFPFQIFEEELINPLNGVQLTPIEEFISNLLLDATSACPLRADNIREKVMIGLEIDLSFRELKKIIRSLRRNHAFPILTRRSSPAGYWWCASADEMKEFARLWQSQYYDEMRTLYVMMKHNYPRLAGQLRLPQVSASDVK